MLLPCRRHTHTLCSHDHSQREDESMWGQVFTLLGVVLGAGTSYVFTSRLERARNQREMVIRWDVRKYDAFTEYLAAVTQMARVAGQLVRERGFDNLAAGIEHGAGLASLDRFESMRTA